MINSVLAGLRVEPGQTSRDNGTSGKVWKLQLVYCLLHWRGCGNQCSGNGDWKCLCNHWVVDSPLSRVCSAPCRFTRWETTLKHFEIAIQIKLHRGLIPLHFMFAFKNSWTNPHYRGALKRQLHQKCVGRSMLERSMLIRISSRDDTRQYAGRLAPNKHLVSHCQPK